MLMKDLGSCSPLSHFDFFVQLCNLLIALSYVNDEVLEKIFLI